MLRVTVEIWPFGDPKAKREIGVIEIGNISNCAPISDYLFKAYDYGSNGPWHDGIIKGHKREDGAFKLINEVFKCIFTSTSSEQPKATQRRRKKTVKPSKTASSPSLQLSTEASTKSGERISKLSQIDIPLNRLYKPKNYEKRFDCRSHFALARSIAATGLQSPVLVERTRNGRWRVIDGWQRVRATFQLGLKTIKCVHDGD